jgi:hypothetical protein
MQPTTWDQTFYAQRADRPLAATTIGSCGLYSIVMPPLASEGIVQRVIQSVHAWIEKPVLGPGEHRHPS